MYVKCKKPMAIFNNQNKVVSTTLIQPFIYKVLLIQYHFHANPDIGSKRVTYSGINAQRLVK